MLKNYLKVALRAMRRQPGYTAINVFGLAFLIAAPLAYLAMRQWLNQFAYAVDVGLGTLLLVGLGALVTVSYQAVKAALADPVEALRYE